MPELLQFALVVAIFLGMLVCGLWIPMAIGVAASVYTYISFGWAGFGGFGLASWGSMNSFTLTAIPLFILMAEFMIESGLTLRVYRGLSYLVRRLPGRLLQTNILGCAVFAAISGSSVATAVAIGSVALPQLEERGYSRGLAAGTVAAGGTLGILIPPSIAMIIYGTFTDTSIAKLFIAGLVPGILLVVIFMVYVAVRCKINPKLAPDEARVQRPPLLQISADLLPFGLLIIAVIGSLYLGIATPTEAAGVGAFVAAVIARIWGTLTWSVFRKALQKAVASTSAIMFIVLAAYLLSYSIAMVGITDDLAAALHALALNKTELLLAIVLLYTVLGFFMESIGIMVITIPILHPILTTYGIDSIWFGVLMVMLIELGQIHPPIGINLFMVKAVSPKASFDEITMGVLPFCGLMYLMMGLLALVPQIALWLPGRM